MKCNIKVCLGKDARVIGTLRYNQQGARESAVFEYTASWLASPGSFLIEPNLRLVAGPQFHQRSKEGSIFHGSIADTEPDGWGKRVILRDHAKARNNARKSGAHLHKDPLNSLDFLLAVDDFSRVGALRFQDQDGMFKGSREDGNRRAPPLIELGRLMKATNAVESNTETYEDLAYLRGRGTSLGGMRPKCSVVDSEGYLCIGKFPSIKDERPVSKGEVLALRLAASAGIKVASAQLVDSDGIPVALIRRFDRSKNGGRLMYISSATLLGVEATSSEQHCYTEIVDAIRVHGASAKEDIDELWRRIAFSILITNTDDHLLNHGFLHVEQGKWRLAPAFDINPFPERVRELKTWISEQTGPEATIDALMSVAPYFQIPDSRAKAILLEINSAVDRWRQQGRKLGMTEAELNMFGSAFEHTERTAATIVCSAK